MRLPRRASGSHGGDCTKLLDVEGAKESVVVKVERDTKSIQVELRVYVFKAVPELRQRFSSGGERRWRLAPTEDARLYNVTLFADADLVSVRKAETISREAYTLKGSDLVGNVFQVQPCADVHTCGDSQRIRLQEPPDPAPEYDLIIIIVSVVGGVVVVSIIGSLVALSDYDGWGEARLDVRAQLRPQVPVYDEWGSRRLGQGPQPPRQKTGIRLNEASGVRLNKASGIRLNKGFRFINTSVVFVVSYSPLSVDTKARSKPKAGCLAW
ncbi:hypothetical protein C7M84_002123 [Penaeus vannamei]|uniref:Uncharacterized protein n=1 Tax=Penaeus vannamei TaxID=6689 RepID=A0A423TRT8_PENVA|nr:hypothetical protein C7M84_002123 [Penaeus vannamei]